LALEIIDKTEIAVQKKFLKKSLIMEERILKEKIAEMREKIEKLQKKNKKEEYSLWRFFDNQMRIIGSFLSPKKKNDF